MNRSGNTGLTARLLWKQRGRAFSFGVAECVVGILVSFIAQSALV